MCIRDRSGFLAAIKLTDKSGYPDNGYPDLQTLVKGKSIIGLQDLFTLDNNNKGTKGHTLKLSKMRCTGDCRKYFF